MCGSEMILAAIAVLMASGFPACFFPSRSVLGQRLTVALMFAGSALGMAGVIQCAGLAQPATLSIPWFLPWGMFSFAADSISCVFLAPVFAIPLLGSIYGLGYWKQDEHPANGRRLGLFYGLLAGSMALVVTARDGVLFLVAWELMAMAAWFASTVEDDNPDVRHAGWVYLIATHIGTLCLIAMFALWKHVTHSFALQPAAEQIPQHLANAIFVLSIVGFGFKAGLMPLHVWLPGAHANAPSHVSAVMSGVMIKMGVYGIVRMAALLPVGPHWWGYTLLIAGVATGAAAIAFALGQNDIKRLLAYSSIENIGIIAIGLGLALLGRSYNRPEWMLLGLSGAMLHVWNHSLFKSLLFFVAGTVIHVTHTRDMNLIGGLARRMPLVAGLSVIGAMAICGLPPMNGFISKWLVYSGLFRTVELTDNMAAPAAALAAVALAMIGALAVACFVKLTGSVFLGMPRTEHPISRVQVSLSMLSPMILLAIGCLIIGVLPMPLMGILGDAVKTWGRLESQILPVEAVASIRHIASINLALVLAAGSAALAAVAWIRTKKVTRGGTWDCGYARPTARIQYTGSSFAQFLVQLFSVFLWPLSKNPAIRRIFPASAYFNSTVPDTVLDRLVQPVFVLCGRLLPSLRVFQQGQTHFYVLYILLIVILLLTWATIGV